MLLGDTSRWDGVGDGTINDDCDDDRRASTLLQFAKRVSLC